MAIKVKEKQISLSVRDLLHAAPRPQMLSSFPLPRRGVLGTEAQVKVQRQKQKHFGLFHREYRVSRDYSYNNYTFSLQGRIDGVYKLKNRAEIEEIKSVILNAAEWKKITLDKFPQFLEQVFFYAYLLQDELEGIEIKTYLVLINLINDARRTFTVSYNRMQTEQLLFRRFAFIINNIEREKEEQKRRQELLAEIDFGLAERRPQQERMMEATQSVFANGGCLMVSAPTGTGKTAAALFPAVRQAFTRGQKIFFVTPKTSQQNIVRETLSPLTEQGLDLHVLFLRASEKMCANPVYFCHESFCPYINNYHDRLDESGLISLLLERERILTPEIIYEQAVKHTLCPFEVSMDLSIHCDIVAGDYNYVFDPAVYLRRLFRKKDYSDWLLIIDEAHNLYDRGLGYLSPEVKHEQILSLIEQTGSKKGKVYQKLQQALLHINNLFAALNEEGLLHFSGQQYFKTDLNPQAWSEVFTEYEAAFIKYLIFKVKKKIMLIEDPLENLYYTLRRFVQTAQFQDRAFVPFYNAQNGGILKIQCCDPSHYLNQRLEGFQAVLAMSATLDPMPFYKDVLGFEALATETLQLDSPFPAANRKVLIVPGISTRYKDRVQNYQKIAEIIERVVALKKGNYLIFFPSFDFMQNVYLFLGRVRLEKIMQKPGMSEAQRDEVLERLRSAESGHLLLAVMGGVFSEGIDYSGQMADGVFIISPALPKISYERELLRAYYQQKQDLGMEYAYIYPGMNKVIQAAGRLIRAASDRGIVVLIGDRFTEDSFHHLLPSYWFGQDADMEVTANYETAVQKFWAKF